MKSETEAKHPVVRENQKEEGGSERRVRGNDKEEKRGRFDLTGSSR